jgi:hypothetical protein
VAGEEPLIHAEVEPKKPIFIPNHNLRDLLVLDQTEQEDREGCLLDMPELTSVRA